MLARIINLLVVEDNEEKDFALSPILHSLGHNVFTANSNYEALKLLNNKQFVLIFLNIDIPNLDAIEFIKLIDSNKNTRNATIILTSDDKTKIYKIISILKRVSVDYMIAPYLPSLIKAKINVYKKLHYRHLRVNHLLENILPAQTLSEFGMYGKSSPKRKTDCAVLFTDFINFTQKTKDTSPEKLVKNLDYYFSAFDEITQKYQVEKIKTIGDAYMAATGVTENYPFPSIRLALCALEIKHFMQKDRIKQQQQAKGYWEIRMGIHSGSLVAGVVGKQKFIFDVWGDTVNIASRCEQNSLPNEINISATYHQEVADYFVCTDRGEIEIKNGGKIKMYFLKHLLPNYSLNNEGTIPTPNLREQIGLPREDFEGLRAFILEKLTAELDKRLTYHSVTHTLAVENAVLKYAKLEKLSDHELFLVQTAALFHDTGFLVNYSDNEKYAVTLLNELAPLYGYLEKDIEQIAAIILSTAQNAIPKNLLEEIMCDADLDYLGRPDYHQTAFKLFKEMDDFVLKLSPIEKLERQIDYLENKHCYYTTSAKNIREVGKQKRIKELKAMLQDAKKNPSTVK